jgi:hypothetical protein
VDEISVTKGADQLVANGNSSAAIRASLRDTAKRPIIGATVHFTTTIGTLSSSSAVTDADGMAEVRLTAARSLGTASVEASYEGYSKKLTVPFVAGPVAELVAGARPATVNPGGTSVILVRALDAHNNRVTEEPLTYVIAADNSGASLGGVSGTTNANGELVVNYTAGSTEGTDLIQFRAGSNGTTGSVSVTVSASAQVVGFLSLSSAAASVVANGSTVSIRARVLDTNNIPLAGARVDFGDEQTDGCQWLCRGDAECGNACRYSQGNGLLQWLCGVCECEPDTRPCRNYFRHAASWNGQAGWQCSDSGPRNGCQQQPHCG